MKKIKPCPFCGGNPSIQETEGCDYVMTCDGCGVQMMDDLAWGVDGYDAEKNVIGKWNRRHLQPDISENYEPVGD